MRWPVVLATATVVGAYAAMIIQRCRILPYGLRSYPLFGRHFVIEGRYPENIVPTSRYGYDGQFFYHLVLDPFPHSAISHGLIFDDPAYRAQRVLYPLLARVLSTVSGVDPLLSLVLINLAAVMAIAGAGIVIARVVRAPLICGPTLALVPGVVEAVGHDTSEAVALAFAIGGLAAWQSGHRMMSAVLLAAAALANENTLVLTGAIVVAELVIATRAQGVGHRLRRISWLVVPVGVEAVWQLYGYAIWGTVPALNGSQLGLPGTALVRALVADPRLPVGSDAYIRLLLPVSVALMAVALIVTFRSPAPLVARVGLLLGWALGLSLSYKVWMAPAGWTRAWTISCALAVVVVWGCGRRAAYAAAVVVVILGVLTAIPFLTTLPGT